MTRPFVSGESRPVHVTGAGVVARRLARLLAPRPVTVHDLRTGWSCRPEPGSIVVVAHGGPHSPVVSQLLSTGVHVVTVGDALDDVASMLDHDLDPGDDTLRVVLGAAMSPGLSGLLARHVADGFDSVDEIHVAVHGTAGPACAREHHRSLSGLSPSWRDGQWADHVGGSGRELCWFPEPVGAADSYRARIATPLLLHRAFPDVDRISVRRTARRRDRFTAWLPMLRPPPTEGGVGALRVEVRGADSTGARTCTVVGVAEPVGSVAAATAAAFVTAIADDLLPPGLVTAGDAAVPTGELLRRITAYGVRLQEFTGVPQARRSDPP